MIADKFGDTPNAYLFLLDSTGKYEAYQPTCEINPVFGEYCFDCSQAADGDFVNILVHGFNIQHSSEVNIIFHFNTAVSFMS